MVHIEIEKGSEIRKEATVLCYNCNSWYQKETKKSTKSKKHLFPPNSIAAGIDFGFGKRLSLESPSLLENMIIAKVRHFHNVVKIQGNHQIGGRSDCTKSQLRAHSILFRQNAPELASTLLLSNQMRLLNLSEIKDLFKSYITIQLVGPKGEIEKIGRLAKFQTHLRVKAHVIYQRLAILQHIHLLYKNDPKLNLYDSHSMKKAIDEAYDEMIQSAIEIKDENTLNAEKLEEDDVAQIRTKVLDKVDV